MAWTVWNLFLATLPIPFGLAIARRLDERNATLVRRTTSVALAAGWLLLLPNAPYLLTEIRHFVLDDRFRALTAQANHEPAALRMSALWGALFVVYGAVGVAAYVAAVRPVERAFAARGVPRAWFRVALHPTVALGVWLGLVPRLNSWDAILHPDRVLGAALHAATHAPTALSIAGFAVALAAFHGIANVVATTLAARGRPALLAPTPASAPDGVTRAGR